MTDQEQAPAIPENWIRVEVMISPDGNQMSAIGGDREAGEGYRSYIGYELLRKKIEPDYRELCEKFTEIVAVRLDAYEQRVEGIWPPNTDIGRGRRRYRGTPQNELPPHMVELNMFKTEVDQFVAMLMQALTNT